MTKPEPDKEQRSLFKEPKKKGPAKEPMLYVVRAATKLSYCRGPNCRKPVYWVYNPGTGRSVIVDCAPRYPGNVKAEALRGQPHAMADRCFPPVHPMAPGEHHGVGRDGQGIDHHLTCADVAVFGRKTERKNG